MTSDRSRVLVMTCLTNAGIGMVREGERDPPIGPWTVGWRLEAIQYGPASSPDPTWTYVSYPGRVRIATHQRPSARVL